MAEDMGGIAFVIEGEELLAITARGKREEEGGSYISVSIKEPFMTERRKMYF